MRHRKPQPLNPETLRPLNYTWFDVVREVFPGATDDECDGLLWEHTGFPSFWKGEPIHCALEQLREFKVRVDAIGYNAARQEADDEMMRQLHECQQKYGLQ